MALQPLFLALFVFVLTLHASQVEFTPQEKAYIKQHPVVTLGADHNWPPYDFVDTNGKHTGIAADILKLLSQKSGLKFQVVPDVWATTMQKMQDHQLDGLTCAAPTPKRKKFLLFSDTYVTMPLAIVVQNDTTDIHSFEDLEHKTVAVNKGSYLHEWFTKNHPHIKLHLTTSNAKSLEAVAFAQADAYIGNIAVATYIMQHNFLTNLTIVGQVPNMDTKVSIAIDKTKPLLFSIIQKTLRSLTKEEKSAIINKWYSQAQASKTNSLKLTPKERQWIEQHPNVTVGLERDWAPIDFMTPQGEYVGIAVEYLKEISKISGVHFSFRSHPQWSKTMQQFQDKQIDMLAAVYKTPKRETYMSFSKPYFQTMDYFFIRKDTQASSIQDLAGKRVAVVESYAQTQILQKEYPYLKRVPYPNLSEAITAVAQGKADVVFDTYSVLSYLVEQKNLQNIITPFAPAQNNSGLRGIHIAVQPEHQELISIINKSLDTLTSKQKEQIQNHWVSSQKPSDTLQLSQREKTWIKYHPVIRVGGGPDWAPVDFTKDGKYTGITKDYLDLISKRTGLKFQVVVDKWSNNLKKIKSKEIDMLGAVYYRPGRAKYMNFTQPYFELLDYFFIRKGIKAKTLTDLNGKTVAMPKGYAHAEIIEKEFPEIHILYVDTFSEALDAVAKGKADILFDTYASISYTIQQEGIRNIIPFQGYRGKEVNKIHMTTRQDYEILTSILDKALTSITPEEHKKIRNKWLTSPPDYTLFYQIAALLFIVILGFIYWNRKLSKEIAKRKRIELELEKQRQKAIAASQAKSEFLSNMSHEIRTPMNAILGFTELLDEQLDNPRLKSYVKTIRSAGDSLLMLINDILDLSKIEAGKLDIETKPTNIHKLIEEIGSIFTLSVQNKGLDLIIDIDKTIPNSLLLDETRLRQILLNLVGNAVKFTSTGHIKIKVHSYDVDEHLSRLNLQIDVEDTGMGIPADQIEKIFGKFEQISGQDNRKFGGTGLGLAISSKLASMMDGKLSVQSVEGEGATFTLQLHNIDITSITPDDTSTTIQNTQQEQIVFETSTLLIVDDIQDNRDLIVKNFESTPVTILSASNGAEAVAIVEERQPDAILMDIRMPVMDGYEATQKIRAKYPHIPIIALTASVMADESEKQKRAHFDGFLRKPVRKQELYETLSQFLPHTKVALQTKHNTFELDLDNISKIDLEKLRNLITQEIAPLKHKASQSNNMADITALAHALEKVAQEYKLAAIQTIATQFIDAVDTFDIAAIEQLFVQIDKILDEISKK